MRNEHIIEIIDSEPFARLSEAQLTTISAHALICEDCRCVFEAAQVSQLLVKEGAREVFEPSPFFHTRVLATLRERQKENESWSLIKMWRAAGALASTMAVFVAALAALTFTIPGSSSAPATAPVVAYSAEEVILNYSESTDEQPSDGQLLNTIYADEER